MNISPRPWAARFVTTPLRRPDEAGGPAPYFRRDFDVQDGLRRATLRLTALGLIDAYLNGTRVGDEVLAPGWTSYAHRLAVSSHDVTGLLRPGPNALGAIVGDGWAVGRFSWEPDNRRIWADSPAAFLELELDYGDRVETVASDASWRTAAGAVLADSIYDGEEYDARLEPAGWSEPGFDDSAWVPVEELERHLRVLFSAEAPPIRRTQELPPRAILKTPAGKTVVDFGQNLVGWVRIAVEAEPGTRISLHHSELMVAGEVDFETNRTARAEDVYICRGGGPETWEPSFTFHGFRYVEVAGWPGEAKPEQFTAVVVHTDMERTGWFECSNELVNQLHRNAVWSMRGNFVGVPTDCPQRDERLGWTGDINAFAPAAAFLYDVRGVLGSWLQDLMAEQLELGFVPVAVPDVLRKPAPITALWSDVAVSLPWLLYEEYGDAAVLERQYPSMTALIDSIEPLLVDGLWNRGFQFGDWLDPDAPPKSPGAAKTRREVVATAFLCKTTQELADAARVLGRDGDAQRYSALHDRVRAAFRREWVTEAGLLVNETATGYALAICFGILDASQQERAGERLAALVADSGHRISTGFAGTPWVLHALSRTGHLDTAYRLLLQTEIPSFLYPVTQGATTIWERWDAVKPDGTLNSTGMTSLNHYALGAVVDWLHRVAGGIDRAQPGYRRLRIAPMPGGGIEHATTAHRIEAGEIKVRWSHAGGQLELEVEVPAGVTAEVTLPLHPDGLVEQVEGGSHRWSYAALEPPPAVYTLDSTLRDLAGAPERWSAVRVVLVEKMPEATVDQLARLWPEASLRDLIARVSSGNGDLEGRLAAALAE